MPTIADMLTKEIQDRLKELDRARDPEYTGTETTDWGDVDKTWENYVDGYFEHNPDAEQPEGEDAWEEVTQAPQPAREWIAAKSLLGDPDAETFDELVSYPVVNPNTNDLNAGGLRAAISFAGGDDTLTVEQRESVQEVARRLLDDEFEDDDETNDDNGKERDLPWLIIERQKSFTAPVMQSKEFKATPQSFGAVEDVDIKDNDPANGGVVTGFYASFGTLDSDGEIFRRGAFAESISEWGPESDRPRIKHLAFHDPWEPVGKIRRLEENDIGLAFETFIPPTRLGKDTLIMYESGVITEHSVGFNRQAVERTDDATIITKARLWEGSHVTWGANPNTPFTGFKSRMDAMETLTEKQTYIAERITRVQKALRGDLEDATRDQLDCALETLKSEIANLRERSAFVDLVSSPINGAEDRDAIIKEINDATMLSIEDIKAIASGEAIFPVRRDIDYLAEILGIKVDDMLNAAEKDGHRYARQGRTLDLSFCKNARFVDEPKTETEQKKRFPDVRFIPEQKSTESNE